MDIESAVSGFVKTVDDNMWRIIMDHQKSIGNTDMETIQSKHDWKWYKASLDINSKYAHRHLGEPEKYPCKVRSEFYDNPNGPYTYNHEFIYQETIKCKECGHENQCWAV